MTKAHTFLPKLFFLAFTFLLLNHSVFGQCPVANNCTPGNAPSSAFPFGMGIYNVSVGSGTTGFTNATSGGASQGYQDYSCAQQATIPEGVAISISVTTNPNANENVRVWLDLNNNGTFDNTTELIFSSINAKVHTGSFTIPVNAAVIKNTVLRMRVSADNFSSPLPTPCSAPQYSQVEDYGITVIPNTNKPAVDFSVNNPVTCSPVVQFQNQTQNGATSWLWDFGDGNTSAAANPSHTYAATGTYSVKLKACNANGCDSLTKTNYVAYQANTIVAASCTPATSNYCCGYGITNVNFGNGLMVNSSADGSVGYEDFTCSKIITASAGKTYTLALTTGNLLQDTKIYIDLDNDGAFTGPNETIAQLFSHVNPVINLTIPTTTFLNVPLRMRIISDIENSPFYSCGGIQSGQAEDYAIRIIEPPFAAFTHSIQTMCDGQINFTENSTRNPTSWHWNFGDPASGTADTSTLRHPTHTFSSTGTYTVTLKSCNSQGCDSISAPVTVIANPNINLTSTCIPRIIYNNPRYSIHGFTFAGISNNLIDSSDTYLNLACNKFTNIIYGNNYQINVLTQPSYLINVQVFIDFDNDGDFGLWERILNSTSTRYHSGSLKFPTTFNPIRNTYLRMRVMSSSHDQALIALPCGIRSAGETEDYAVMILDPTGTPETYFNEQLKLYPNPSTGTFFLEIHTVFKGEFQLEVQNMIGQNVAKQRVRNKDGISKIDLSYLSKGIYLVKIFNAEFSAVKKIVIE